jgi:hypothetical protein
MTVTTPMIPGNKKRSTDYIILSCKAVGCPWDPYAPTIRAQDYYRTGWFWFKHIRCLNCGSIKIEKYNEGDIYFENRIGKPKYDRPPDWYELKFYWGAARAELARRGYTTVSMTEGADDGNVIKLRAGA